MIALLAALGLLGFVIGPVVAVILTNLGLTMFQAVTGGVCVGLAVEGGAVFAISKLSTRNSTIDETKREFEVERLFGPYGKMLHEEEYDR